MLSRVKPPGKIVYYFSSLYGAVIRIKVGHPSERTLRFNVATSDLDYYIYRPSLTLSVRRSISRQRATIWVVKESFESDIYALVSSLLKTR